jgi:hypothetical protein
MRYVWMFAAALLLVTGCFGGDGDDEATASPTPATETTPTRTATAAGSPTSTGTPGAEECGEPGQLTADEQQPSSDPGSTKGSVVAIDSGAHTIHLEPLTGLPAQVEFDESTRFLFSDGREASVDDLECGASVAATGTHELRGRLVAEVLGIIVPREEEIDPEQCPIDADSCSYASQLANHVLNGNGDGVLADADGTAYECPGPNSSLGGPYPLCNGAQAGEVRIGFPFITTFQGEGSVLPAPDASRIISEWATRADPSLSDEFGNGAPAAYSIACAGVRLDEGAECDEEFSLTFSGLTPGASAGQPLGRWMLVIYVERDDQGQYRAEQFASGVLMFSDVSYALEGGTGLTFDPDVPRILAPTADGGEPFVTFFPWEPLELAQ